MEVLHKFISIFNPKYAVKRVYNSFLTGNKNLTFAVIYQKHLLAMIEHSVSLDKAFFREIGIKIEEEGFFVTLEIPKESPIDLSFNSKFTLKGFQTSNDFFLTEEGDNYNLIGKFFEKESSEYLVHILQGYLKNIYEIKNQKLLFDLMYASKKQ